jgi:hypothetical protein
MAVVKLIKNTIKCQTALIKAVEYITNPKKASAIFVSDNSNFVCATYTAISFEWHRKIYGQEKGIIAHHYVQSFSPDDNLIAEQAHKIGVEFCKKCFPEYQYVVATHNDRSHFHNHIILNSVNLETGGKWHSNKTSLKFLRQVSDELCMQNNLSVIENDTKTPIKSIDRTTYQLALQGKSWKIELVKLLDIAVKSCNSKLQFIDFFNKHNYKIKYTARNITFQKDGEKKGNKG